jgi:hypothetical protein
MADMHAQEREIQRIVLDGDIEVIAIDEGDDYTIAMSADSWNRAVAKLRAGKTIPGLALTLEPDGDVSVTFYVGAQAGFSIRRPTPLN